MAGSGGTDIARASGHPPAATGEDIDNDDTIMDRQLRQISYAAALATAAKVLQPSLIDFLR